MRRREAVKKIQIYDTTLRDGMQAEGVSLFQRRQDQAGAET